MWKNISDHGLRIIRTFDVFLEKAYTCPGGSKIIGYGHVIRPDEPYALPGYKMLKDEGYRLLDLDVDIAEAAVNRLVTVPIDQNEFDALASFVFNVGVGAFMGSRLLRLLNREEREDAASEFNRWNKAAGKEQFGLKLRKKMNETLFEEKK